MIERRDRLLDRVGRALAAFAASRAFARTWAAQADVERASRRVPDIADDPIMAEAAAMERYADRPFGPFGQQAREFGGEGRGGRASHACLPDRALRSPAASAC